MSAPRISLSDSVELYLDVPRLLDGRALITGNSGAGKSRLFRRIAERAFPHVQMVILDPEGEFPTLREKHPFLLAGPGGEVVAEPRAAGLLARRLLELRVSAVVDLYDLKLPERRRFVRLFLEALDELPKALYQPLLVLIDEAHVFCPEKSAGEAESTAAVIDLMTRGRKRGHAGLLATQRLSKLHKDAAAEAKNVFIGGITLDVDQKRAGDSLGLGQRERLALRDIPSGVFQAFGPGLSLTGVVQFEVGASETSHPRAGQRHKIAPPAPPEAIRRLVAELQDLPQQAAEEVRSLDAAKARIRELERAAKTAPKAAPAPVPQTIERNVVAPAALKRLEQAVDRMAKHADALDVARDRLAQAQQVVLGESALLRDAIARAASGSQTTEKGEKGAGAVPGRRPGPPAAPASVVPVAQRLGVEPAAEDDVAAVSVAARRLLFQLLHREGAATREELGVLAVYRSDTGHFGNLLSELRSGGHITTDARGIRLTESGAAIAAATTPPDRSPLDGWLAKLSPLEGKVLQVIVDAPDGITRAEAGERVGLRADTGHFGNQLSALRSNGLIGTDRSGLIQLHPLLREGA